MLKNNNLLISIIVSTYNGESYINNCLTSLVNQTLSKDKYEVIVVNNNSTDNTEEICKKHIAKYDNFKFFNENEQGLSCARNRGIKEANGEYIAFIDDDAKADSKWCENILIAFITISPKPVVVGGKILPYYNVKPPSWFSDELEIRSWGNNQKFLKEKDGFFSGSNMAFQKSILNQYDGFKPEYGINGDKFGVGEETDLIRRISIKHPHLFYSPDLIVYHLVKEKNMKISGRLKRAYSAGLYRHSLFDGNNIVFLLLNLSRLGYYILYLLFYLITFKYNYKFIHSLEMCISKISSIIDFVLNKEKNQTK